MKKPRRPTFKQRALTVRLYVTFIDENTGEVVTIRRRDRGTGELKTTKQMRLEALRATARRHGRER